MIIYKITNLINNKCYIGQTSQDLKKRIKSHKYNKGTILNRAFKKYGFENFKIEVISQAKDFIELDKLEQNFIKEYDCLIPNGYNISLGGQKSHGTNPETKKKLSIAGMGRKPWNAGQKGTCKLLSTARQKYYKINQHHRSKPVLWTNMNIIFNSCREAARYLNCKSALISRVCLGKRKSWKNNHFEYLDPSLWIAS